MEHVLQWVAPSPMWNRASRDPILMRRPELLRFASDSFMEELAAVLAANPEKLADYVAAPETFQERPIGVNANWTSPAGELKLYLPAHGHFYLVAANLTCQMPGLPDHTVRTVNLERAAFLMRRRIEQREWAWVDEGDGGKRWKLIAAGKEGQLADGEERLPMFPVNFLQEGQKRRLLVGLVPTASRDTAQPKGLTQFATDNADDPRMAQVEDKLLKLVGSKRDTNNVERRTLSDKDAQFVLLDLAEWLQKYAPTFWREMNKTPHTEEAFGSEDRKTLFRILGSTNVSATLQAWGQRKTIQTGTGRPIAHSLTGTQFGADNATLRAALASVLEPAKPTKGTPQDAPRIPKLEPGGDAKYVLRCSYERPRCGPLHDPVVSDATREFALSTFFDPDAPGRPIRLEMPIDTTPEGLRKYRKNVAFLISNTLRKQMSKAGSLEDLLDGKTGPDGPDLGMICSFSIPIITICALIVLMIFIALLNIVFFWIPFVKICLPLNLKAKG